MVKRELLKKAGIDTTGVTFAAADFDKEDWLARLVDAGFEPDKPALFIWEEVMMYLDREAVESTDQREARLGRLRHRDGEVSRPRRFRSSIQGDNGLAIVLTHWGGRGKA